MLYIYISLQAQPCKAIILLQVFYYGCENKVEVRKMVNAIGSQYAQYPQYQPPVAQPQPVQYQPVQYQPATAPQQPVAQPQPVQYQPTQYAQPQPVQYMQPQTTPVGPSVGAVNIQIYNPTAGGTPQPMMPSYPYYPQYQPYPMPYPYPYPMPYPNQCQCQGQNNGGNANANANADANANATTTPPAPAPAPATNENKKNEKVVVLTDDYIRSLENYLNNQDPKIRMQGVNELLKRFKEDKSRMNDAALTALLNKALQDPSASVRFMALTVLDVGYAGGNDETVNILKQLESQNGSVQQNEDARLASQVLLKASGQTVEMPAGTGHNPPKEETKAAKQ